MISRPLEDPEQNLFCDVKKDLKKYKWVMREPGSGTAQTFKRKLGKYVVDLDVVMELGHTEAIKKAVEAGAGVGCLSNLTVCRAMNRGWLQQIELKGVDLKRQLYVIQHKNKAKTRLMNEFLDFCFLLSQCDKGRSCLSSPENFQDLVLQFSKERSNRSRTRTLLQKQNQTINVHYKAKIKDRPKCFLLINPMFLISSKKQLEKTIFLWLIQIFPNI